MSGEGGLFRTYEIGSLVFASPLAFNVCSSEFTKFSMSSYLVTSPSKKSSHKYCQ